MPPSASGTFSAFWNFAFAGREEKQSFKVRIFAAHGGAGRVCGVVLAAVF